MRNKVFWLGGSSCSGKSTLGKRLSEKHGFNLYSTDEFAFGKFMFDLEDEERFPAIVHYRSMLFEGMDAFARRDVDLSVRAFQSYCSQVFELLLADIRELSDTESVIVEGAHVFPHLIRPVTKSNECVFLVSDRDLQKTIWLKEMKQEIPGGHPGEIEGFSKAVDKKAITETRVEFHDRIGKFILASANELGFRVMRVSGRTSIESLQSEVELALGLTE